MESQPVWCAKCHLEIVPADLRTVYQRVDYHRQCFLLLVREEAEEQVRRKAASVRPAGQTAWSSWAK
jgi:hypothetical protein